ncbi:hypothetical protein, partial [Aeromonas caviae]
YNVQCHIYEGIHSLTEQGCSDNDRDINAAMNIQQQGILELKAAGLVVSTHGGQRQSANSAVAA